MDSEHRHELKTNELAEWIEHFPQFCKKNGSTIIGAILIICAILSYFVFKGKSQQAGQEQHADALLPTLEEQPVTEQDRKVITGRERSDGDQPDTQGQYRHEHGPPAPGHEIGAEAQPGAQGAPLTTAAQGRDRKVHHAQGEQRLEGVMVCVAQH